MALGLAIGANQYTMPGRFVPGRVFFKQPEGTLVNLSYIDDESFERENASRNKRGLDAQGAVADRCFARPCILR